MKALFHRNQHAFSLLEIIIAITIIALFTVLPILAYTSYLKKSRDEKRKSDIARVSQALESYKAEKGTYPPDLQTLVTSGFLPELPKDPLEGQAVPWDLNGGTFGYSFSSPDGTSYTLTAKMESGGASGGNSGGSGTSAMSGGNISGTFSGTGNGAINSATVRVAGTVSNNTFTGSFNGSVTGNGGLSGTINGTLNKGVTGTASGNVAGTATVTVGTVTGTNFTGTYTGFNVVGVTGSGGGGTVCIATANKPSCEVIPVITLTQAAQFTATPGAPTATGYLSPTPISAISNTPTPTYTPTPTFTPTNTPTRTPTPTNTPTPSNTPTPTPTPRYWSRTIPMPYGNYTSTLLMYPKNATNIIGIGGRWTGSSGYAQIADIAGSGILTQNRMLNGTTFTTDALAYSPTSDGGGIMVTQALGIAKLDSNFNITWSKSIPSSLYASSVAVVGATGYVVSGYGYSGQMFVMKFDTAGNFLWEKDYSINWTGPWGSQLYGVDAKVAVSSTTGKIAVLYSWQENGGTIYNYDLPNEYIIRETIIYKIVYDTNGNVLASENIIGVNQYQTPGNNYQIQNHYGRVNLTSTSDGGFIGTHPISVPDSAYGNDYNNRERVFKMDGNGTITARLDIDLNQYGESAEDIRQLSDGGYLVVLNRTNYNGAYTNPGPADGTDVVLEKLTSGLAHSWTKIINTGNYEYGYKATQMTNGDILFSGYYAVGGTSNSNKLILKMDSTGGITGCASVIASSLSPNVPSATPTPGGGRATITPAASGSPFYTQTTSGAKTASVVSLSITNPTDTQGMFCTY